MSELVVIVPTRGRHQRLRRLARRFERTTRDYRMLFVVDPDDPRSAAAGEKVGDVLVTAERYGYPRKINEGIRASEEPLILMASDDLKPHPGWFETASALLSETIGFVGINDIGSKRVQSGEYSISPLLTRAYAELGTIDGGDGLLFEGYWHNPCDVEVAETAKARGAYAFAPDSVIEHMHPNYHKAHMDRTYAEGGFNVAAKARDDALFNERRALWE